MAEPSPATLKRRDPADVERALTAWLADRLGTGSAPAITRLDLPSGAGYSNETYLFDVDYTPGVGAPGRSESFVLQAAPVGEALFQTYDLRKVFDLQSALATRGIPVARMRWYEPSPDLLGAPFYVMDRVVRSGARRPPELPRRRVPDAARPGYPRTDVVVRAVGDGADARHRSPRRSASISARSTTR